MTDSVSYKDLDSNFRVGVLGVTIIYYRAGYSVCDLVRVRRIYFFVHI